MTERAGGVGVLFVRDAALVSEIDRWVATLNQERPDGPQWTRSSVVRAALRRVLRERASKGEQP